MTSLVSTLWAPIRRTAMPTRWTSSFEDFPALFDMPSPVAGNPQGCEQGTTGPEIEREAELAPPRPFSRRRFVDRGRLLKRKRFGNEIEGGPNAHRSVAAERHQKPESKIRIAPRPHER